MLLSYVLSAECGAVAQSHLSAIAQKTPLHYFQRMIPPRTRPPSAFMTQKPDTPVTGALVREA